MSTVTRGQTRLARALSLPVMLGALLVPHAASASPFALLGELSRLPLEIGLSVVDELIEPASQPILKRNEDSAIGIANSAGQSVYDQMREGVVVDALLTINGTDPLDGAKVSFGPGFVAAEDRLSFTPMHGITGSYNATTGILSLSGLASPAEYQEVLRSVTYTNVEAGVPTAGAREVYFSLGAGALYFEGTGHFYEFVPAYQIRWSEAKAAAQARRYFGLEGYLVTITSAAENAFAHSKITGYGWMGASDEAQERTWRWVTGPEGLEDNGQGRHFFTQHAGVRGGVAVNGYYANFNPNQPDNATAPAPAAPGEHYGQFYLDGTWNDLPDISTWTDHHIQGYLVEYGGMPNDPVVQLSDMRLLLVATCSDGLVNGWESGIDCGAICGVACPDGQGCQTESDCFSGVCSAQVCQAPACGDGVLNGQEACEDGNALSGDGCSASCQVEHGFSCLGGAPQRCVSTCGDGVIASNEACDDGNLTSGDGCSAVCGLEYGFGCQGEPSVCASSCGDGVRASNEACDDGNLTSGDGCSATCVVETGFECLGDAPSACASSCGDGVIASNEACDDGNLTSGDGCSALCEVETGFECTGSTISTCESTCGDGVKASNEACDDGNDVYGDGCDGECLIERGWSCEGELSVCQTGCGDGIKVGTEQCDDGNSEDGDGCSASCVPEVGFGCIEDRLSKSYCSSSCGDSVRASDEGCDDGNTEDGDGCSSICQVEAGFACDDDENLLSGCASVCGDGIRTEDEGCDDGNTDDGEGCSAACEVETGFSCEEDTAGLSSCESTCGDGVKASDEACDDGNLEGGDGCSTECAIEAGWSCVESPSVCTTGCGDGVIAGSEGCDDNNSQDGDGCSAACQIEPGYVCEGEPSACLLVDSDLDGVLDENDNCPTVANADQADLDGDGLGDVCDDDIDGDGLSNTDEDTRGTDPRNPDTDGDGLSDGDEVAAGTDPLDANDPGEPVEPEPSVPSDDDLTAEGAGGCQGAESTLWALLGLAVVLHRKVARR